MKGGAGKEGDARNFQQLSLAVRLDDSATFDNFLPTAGNGLALQAARDAAAGRGSAFLFGAPGSGRSHLLQAACHACQSDARYLPLAELGAHDPALVLENCETAALVVLDDIDAVTADPIWAEQLFHALNRIHAAAGCWLAAAAVPPRQLSTTLPDLQSRLAWNPAVRIGGLDDAQRIAALRGRARLRGLELGSDVASYILNHYSRDPARLFTLLDLLDRRSLELQRRLTLAFVKQVMESDSSL